jgi:hypothetical protein
VNAFDAKLHRELGPFVAALRLGKFMAGIVGDVDQRLFDEPRHHPGIGAAAGNGRGAARLGALGGEQPFTQGVVRARLGPEFVVEVKAGPRLDHGVDVERADLPTQTHDVDRVGVDRDVDAEALAASFGEQLAQ